MSYSIIGLAIAGGLIALGIVGIIISGIRGLFSGEQDFKKIATMALPVVIFFISVGITGDYQRAAIATMLIMMAFMAVGILVTGMRSTFNF